MDTSTLIKGFADPYKKERNIEKEDKEHYEEQFEYTAIIVGAIVLVVIVACIVSAVVRMKKNNPADKIATDTFMQKT